MHVCVYVNKTYIYIYIILHIGIHTYVYIYVYTHIYFSKARPKRTRRLSRSDGLRSRAGTHGAAAQKCRESDTVSPCVCLHGAACDRMNVVLWLIIHVSPTSRRGGKHKASTRASKYTISLSLSLSLSLHTYVCICMYIYIYICMYICIYTYTPTNSSL